MNIHEFKTHKKLQHSLKEFTFSLLHHANMADHLLPLASVIKEEKKYKKEYQLSLLYLSHSQTELQIKNGKVSVIQIT